MAVRHVRMVRSPRLCVGVNLGGVQVPRMGHQLTRGLSVFLAHSQH